MNNKDHGILYNAAEIRFIRLLPGPIERVWDFVTNPEKRQLWFAGGTSGLQPGAELKLVFNNKTLAQPGEVIPEKFQKHATDNIETDATVTACEPPRLYAFQWGDGEVVFELEPEGEKVKLTLTHRRLPDHQELLDVSGGWHIHLEVLVAQLEDRKGPEFWSTLSRLEAEYHAMYGAEPTPAPAGWGMVLRLAASPEKVYEALTSQQGLRSWWTETCDVSGGSGGSTTFHFGPTWKVMRHDLLLPGKEVRWHCTDASLQVPDAPCMAHEWVGTSVHFQIIPLGEDAVGLRFHHEGLTPALACHSICAAGWARFLGSLKQYVETGTGEPFRAAVG